MMNFFRKIRQNLLFKGRPGSPASAKASAGRYLKYAIGEIILVVIGILIALSINNWNERRKENLQLKKSLKSVYNELILDSLLIHEQLPDVRIKFEVNTDLIKKIYATTTTLDTLITVMQDEFPMRWYASPAYSTNTFSNLKSTGSFDLLPTGIKELLLKYYTAVEADQNLNKELLNQYRNQLDDFVKRYNIIGRFYDKNYNNSYLYNTTWAHIEEKDFTPRVAVLLAAYQVLYRNAKAELETNQKTIRIILPQLEPYLDK